MPGGLAALGLNGVLTIQERLAPVGQHGEAGAKFREGGGGLVFTLQNGGEKLKAVFGNVQRFLYEDALEVTDVNDLVDYIRSLTGMSDLQKLPEETIRSVLMQNMIDGVLRIPKEYGMFIAR